MLLHLLLAVQGGLGGGLGDPVVPPPVGRELGCLPAPILLPAFRHGVDLAPHVQCGGGGAVPFAVAYTPDGSRAYATLFGGLIGSSGCTVVRLDPATLQVVGTITSGEGPEELAFVEHPTGGLRYGFVTDSSASTVTVFDAADQVVATIPIPFDPQATYPTAFPYGLAVHPDGQRVFVGTADGQGHVHVIDVDSLALVPSARIDLGANHGAGRLAFAGGRLVVTATEYLPSFSGSTAKVCVVDPDRPGEVEELVLASHSQGFLFPALQDIAVDCAGRAWVAGFDLGARVFAVDPEGPHLLRTIETRTSQPHDKFQALDLSPDGMLWVGDLWSNELALIDVRREHWIRTLDADLLPGFFRAPHEIAFSPDGTTALVVWAASENLAVLDL